MDFFKKIPIAIASLLASSVAFAAMDTDSRVTQQMQQVRTETAMGTYGAKTATARPEVDGKGLFLTLDVLYWYPKVGGTEFAYSDDSPAATLPIHGRTKDIDFDWGWGVRVGLGYNFCYDGWDTHLQYSWFGSNGSDSTSAGLNSSIVPLKGSARIVADQEGIFGTDLDAFVFCDKARSQYDFTYQAIDLELGRAYFVSGKLSFRPHWGLKTAWIDQEQVARYTGGDPVEINAGIFDGAEFLGLGIETVKVTDECDFWGIGPRTGMMSKWHLGYGFSIFGDVAAAILFGYFDVDHREKWTRLESNHIHLSASRHAFSPTVQFQLGLRYDAYIHDNKQHVGVGLGFEGQYWWRQNQMLKVDDDAVLKYERYSEDISMHGVTLDIRFDF